jgi:hypothetical protein
MTHTPGPGTEPDQPIVYRIRIKGHLGPRWNDWFDYMTITPEPNGETILTGLIVDQAALHGVLTKIRDLGLPLLSVMEIESAQAGGLHGNASTGSTQETNQ